jgi:hypothetical protein
MRMGRIGRNFLYCRKALFWLPCCAAGAMALLLAANGVCVSAQAAAPALHAAATQPSTPASPTDIVGIWQGTLHIPKTDQHPQIDLRLVVKISKTDAGALKAVSYSIDQGGQSVPVATINFQDGVLKFTITLVDRRYEGKMSADGKSIVGTWMEGTTPIPLLLERTTPDTAWAIPEPPKPMTADADPTLEVATIKPSQPGRPGKLFTFQGAQFKTFNTNMNESCPFKSRDSFDRKLHNVDASFYSSQGNRSRLVSPETLGHIGSIPTISQGNRAVPSKFICDPENLVKVAAICDNPRAFQLRYSRATPSERGKVCAKRPGFGELRLAYSSCRCGSCGRPGRLIRRHAAISAPISPSNRACPTTK